MKVWGSWVSFHKYSPLLQASFHKCEWAKCAHSVGTFCWLISMKVWSRFLSCLRGWRIPNLTTSMKVCTFCGLTSMKVWMGAAFSCFFVVENNPPAFFWSRFWRFQSGLWDDRTHRQQYQMNITPTSHMEAFNSTPQHWQAGVWEYKRPWQGHACVINQSTHAKIYLASASVVAAALPLFSAAALVFCTPKSNVYGAMGAAFSCFFVASWFVLSHCLYRMYISWCVCHLLTRIALNFF